MVATDAGSAALNDCEMVLFMEVENPTGGSVVRFTRIPVKEARYRIREILLRLNQYVKTTNPYRRFTFPDGTPCLRRQVHVW
jgi:hypothetical protein